MSENFKIMCVYYYIYKKNYMNDIYFYEIVTISSKLNNILTDLLFIIN